MLQNIRIVLVETSHPGNIGATARAMMNMGLEKLYLVQPHKFPSAVATARASGASGILERAQVFESLPEALVGCRVVFGASARSRSIPWPEITPETCAEKTQAVEGEAAIVFGREHSGLTNEELDHCHFLVKIPTNPKFSSLNVAAAVQVLCYEMRRLWLNASVTDSAQPESIEEAFAPATAEDMERFYAHLFEMLQDIGYYDPDNPKRLVRRLHRLFNRAALEHAEVKLMRGMLKTIQEAVKKT